MNKPAAYDTVTSFILSNRDSLYRLAYSYVEDREDALDIVQDSICKALSSVKSLADPSSAKPWLYRIDVNTAIDFLRKHRMKLYVESDRLGASDDSYQDFDLRDAIKNLSTVNRTVIVLHFYENMTLDEIAKVMNENVNTTKTRLYSSLKKLRRNLDWSRETSVVTEKPGLFKDDSYVDVITANIKEQMREKIDLSQGIIYFIKGESSPDETGFDKIDPEQTFYINSDSKLVVVFDEYAVAPGSMGIVEFVVPTEVIAEFLVSDAYVK